MSLFFFGNNFYKNKETFKIFSPLILEVCRILLVQATLESPMFYCTFSVINDRFDQGTALLYDSSNSNIKIAHNCIEHSCGICVIYLLMFCLRNSALLSLDCFHKLCLSGTTTENSQGVEIWGIV